MPRETKIEGETPNELIHIDNSLINKIRAGMTEPLTNGGHLAESFNSAIDAELKIINSLTPKLEERKRRYSELTQGSEAVEQAADYLRIGPLPEKLDNGIFHNEFERRWVALRDKREKVGRELEDLETRISQKPYLEAIRTILAYQQWQLLQLAEVWSQNPEELIRIAKNLKRMGTKEIDDETQKIRLVIQEILEEGPQVKIHLRKTLLKKGFTAVDVDRTIWAILREDTEIEAGWCTNAGRIASGLNHGAGTLFKLPEHQIPADIAFYGGMTREEVTEMLQSKLLEFISKLEQPLMTVKEITQLFNQSMEQPISYSRVNNHLLELAQQELINFGWRGRRQARLYGPKKGEQEDEEMLTSNNESQSP